LQVINETRFPTQCLFVQDRQGRDQLLVVHKATWVLAGEGALRPAEEPAPIVFADEFHGEPGTSTPRWESDIAPVKPAADVVLIGHARAPAGNAGRGVAEIDVTLRIGPVVRSCRVFGRRRWLRTFARPRPSSPEPFEALPLHWEHAFGGRDDSPRDEGRHDWERRNPLGVGFRAKRSRRALAETPLPQIEDPAYLIRRPGDRPPPAGFAFIGRSWEPRLSLAGTYDERWEAHRSPLLPDDLDERYHNAASRGLVLSEGLRAGDPVEVRGATHDGTLRFALPDPRPEARLVLSDLAHVDLPLRSDTLVIDADARRVSLVSRVLHTLKAPPTSCVAVRVRADA